MLGIKNKVLGNENIRNPPSDDEYVIINSLFENNCEIGVSALALTVLELIRENQIRCEISLNGPYSVGKKLTQNDLAAMGNITLRIANKGELKSSQTAAINLLKSMNKSKKFTLRHMARQSNNPSIANKFEKDFMEFAKAVKIENGYDSKDYGDILENGKLTKSGKILKNEWKDFQKYLKSRDLSERYPPRSSDENSSQMLYAACFGIERDALRLRKNDTVLTDFMDKDGYRLLNIIFANALSHVTQKRDDKGVFYGAYDKYAIPGGVI